MGESAFPVLSLPGISTAPAADPPSNLRRPRRSPRQGLCVGVETLAHLVPLAGRVRLPSHGQARSVRFCKRERDSDMKKWTEPVRWMLNGGTKPVSVGT